MGTAMLHCHVMLCYVSGGRRLSGDFASSGGREQRCGCGGYVLVRFALRLTNV
jgi:hypothetical protein